MIENIKTQEKKIIGHTHTQRYHLISLIIYSDWICCYHSAAMMLIEIYIFFLHFPFKFSGHHYPDDNQRKWMKKISCCCCCFFLLLLIITSWIHLKTRNNNNNNQCKTIIFHLAKFQYRCYIYRSLKWFLCHDDNVCSGYWMSFIYTIIRLICCCCCCWRWW